MSLSRTALLVLLLIPPGVLADVVFDGSMGPGGAAPTRITPGFTTDYLVSYDEQLADPAQRFGVRRGANLFQSLDRLDLEFDERVSFTALDATGRPIANLERVITRITNGSRSQIRGVLRSEIPGADLFVLNPAGIDFLGQGGLRRQLDLQGGFVASTADFLRFDDAAVLEVLDLGGFELSAAPVESFGFLGGAPRSIVFDEAGVLEVPQGESFTIVAGDVRFTGFASTDPADPSRTSRVSAPGGTIQLAAVGGATVEVPVDVGGWTVQDAPDGVLGDVIVEKFSDLRTNEAPDDQGRVVLRGGRLVVDDSAVQAGGAGPGTLALDLEAAESIVARDDARLQVLGSRAGGLGGGRLSAPRIEVIGSGGRRTFVGSRASRNTADPFLVDAEQLLVEGSASLTTEVSGSGGGPGADLRIIAEDVRVSNGGEIATRALSGAAPGGALMIETQRLELDAGRVRSDNFLLAPDGSRVFAGGAAGKLEILAAELVMRRDARIEALAGPAGAGGEIAVMAGSVDMSGGSEINSTTINDQNAGDVSLAADTRIHIRGDDPFAPSGIFARTGNLVDGVIVAGQGHAGSVRVRAPVVELTGAALISTRSRGSGNAGDIDVTTARSLTLTGTEVGTPEISARSLDGDVGGSIAVSGGDVVLENGGAIAASTFGSSPGGAIDVDARSLTIRGVGLASSAILSDSAPASAVAAAGDAGRIDVDLGGSLLVSDGGEIRAVTSGGVGNAGTIDVRAGASAEIRKGGRISAAATAGATGEAGDVIIAAPRIALQEGVVSTEARNGTAQGADVGGNIRLTATSRARIRRGSVVSARSNGTQDAGRIVVDGGRSLLLAHSEITTEATEETASAAGGQIELVATKRVELRRGTATTSVRASAGDEDGGDVDAHARFVIVNGSEILAQAILGNGGNIDIAAGSYLQSGDSVVDASSERGIDGTVNVDAPDTELSGQLARLPGRFLDATELLREHCAARVAGRGSFVIGGREGIPAAPDRALSVPMPLPDDGANPAAGQPEAQPGTIHLRFDDADCAALAHALARHEGRR